MQSTEKIDYRKLYGSLFRPPAGRVEEVIVPNFHFAMIDGTGSQEGPSGSPEFQNAIAALFGLSYGLKFGRKKQGRGPDYSTSPLEGLWWMADGSDFDQSRPSDWAWTLMMMQPDFITIDEFDDMVAQLKVKHSNPALDALRLEALDEGRSLQTMHVGPYSQEGPTLKLLDDYCASHGLRYRGYHHEIYLGDPRRAAPDKLKTILRHAVAAL